MSAAHTILILIIGIAMVLAAGCTQQAAEKQVPETPVVTMTNPVAPVPFASTNGINIAYELELNGLDEKSLVPKTIEVIDPATGKVIYMPDAEVFTKTYQKASVPPPTAEERMAGTLKLSIPRISIWFKVSPDNVPDKLVHRLTLNRSATGQQPVIVTGGEVIVRKDLKPVVIGSPVKGDGWVVMETTEPTTHHFLMPVTINDKTTVDQRYAQDWFWMDPVTKETVRGNVTLAKDYLGYGKELLAVADGTVADVHDGIPDNEIAFVKPPIDFATGTGNTVILDIGNDKYACYCHIIPGSIRVKKGDVVKEGDVIGLLGNTGQSDIPHLHIEVVTGKPVIVGGEGYPFVFRSFELTAGLNTTLIEEVTSAPGFENNRFFADFGRFVVPFPQPVPQQEKLQENWAIVRMP